jgi:hypothetical protein
MYNSEICTIHTLVTGDDVMIDDVMIDDVMIDDVMI